ncbi:MAG: hypothetical protein JST04_13390 [Bdellovibrionales bacterium]|nr:hypothetical protein [Bdellovibrionales bacterium]
MKFAYVLTALLACLAIASSLRAEDRVECATGRAVFGKLACASTAGGEPLLDAYFFGATSLSEIRASFPERAAKIGDRCRKKLEARKPASNGSPGDGEGVEFRVETVEVCLGKRGYQQPCVTDDDCIEHYCHPERGTCSAVFTVPISAAQ